MIEYSISIIMKYSQLMCISRFNFSFQNSFVFPPLTKLKICTLNLETCVSFFLLFFVRNDILSGFRSIGFSFQIAPSSAENPFHKKSGESANNDSSIWPALRRQSLAWLQTLILLVRILLVRLIRTGEFVPTRHFQSFAILTSNQYCIAETRNPEMISIVYDRRHNSITTNTSEINREKKNTQFCIIKIEIDIFNFQRECAMKCNARIREKGKICIDIFPKWLSVFVSIRQKPFTCTFSHLTIYLSNTRFI